MVQTESQISYVRQRGDKDPSAALVEMTFSYFSQVYMIFTSGLTVQLVLLVLLVVDSKALGILNLQTVATVFYCDNDI